MKAVSRINSISTLPGKNQRFAFTQDETGMVDLTPGKSYEVYGIRKNKRGTFYLVLTDRIHNKLPWWMPSDFFGSVEGNVPTHWVTRSWGRISKDVIVANPHFFNAIDDIEDGTDAGYRAFDLMKGKQARILGRHSLDSIVPADYEALYIFCTNLFGKSQVTREDLKEPAGIEIWVRTDRAHKSIKQVSLALYRGDHPQSFMHIDDFTFEYDADEKKALQEMRTYLEALKQGLLYIKSRNILGIKFNQRLQIGKRER